MGGKHFFAGNQLDQSVFLPTLCPQGKALWGRERGKEELWVTEHRALWGQEQPCGGVCQGPSQSQDGNESNDRFRGGETP